MSEKLQTVNNCLVLLLSQMHLVSTNRLLVVTGRSLVNAPRIQVTCKHPAVCGATIWKVCTRKIKYTFVIIIKPLGSVWCHIQPVLCCCSVSRNAPPPPPPSQQTAAALRCIPRVRDFHGLSTRAFASWVQGLQCVRRGRLFVCLFVFLGTTSFLEKSKLSGNQLFILGPNVKL